jgi:hypothetical protein
MVFVAEYPSGHRRRRDAAPIGSRVIYPDARMKQAQSGTSSHLLAGRGRWWSIGPGAPRPMGLGRRQAPIGSEFGSGGLGSTVAGLAWSSGRAVLALLAAAWSVATLPFRLVFWVIAWLGRLTGIAIGFALMVAGMFFLAGPFFLIGIPLFLIGLVLTLRCLE